MPPHLQTQREEELGPQQGPAMPPHMELGPQQGPAMPMPAADDAVDDAAPGISERVRAQAFLTPSPYGALSSVAHFCIPVGPQLPPSGLPEPPIAPGMYEGVQDDEPVELRLPSGMLLI